MPKRILSLLMTLMLCLTGLAAAQETEHGPYTMNINGSARVQAAPDKAVLVVKVSTYDKDAQIAQAKNAEIASRMAESLKSLGVTARDMETNGYYFNTVYSQEKNKTNKVIGYTAVNDVSITINDISLAGKVVDTALKAGATDIGSLEFGLKDPAPFKKQAMELAVADAKAKAEVIAKGLGVQIAGVKLVRENAGSITSLRANAAMLDSVSSGMAKAHTTPIEAGELELSATVYVEFIIK